MLMRYDPLAGADALLLDWDGTLADTISSNYANLTAVLAAHGAGVDRAWYDQHVGLALADLLDVLRAVRPALPDTAELVTQCRARWLAALGPVTAIPATLALLDRARRRGLPCPIASGAAADIVHAGITALGLRGQFGAVITRGDVAVGKPAPDLFAVAAARLNVVPGLCAAVDDAPDGIAAAYAAGIGRVLTLQDAVTGRRRADGQWRCCRVRRCRGGSTSIDYSA
jgi:beta-phosphoglucomutase-like phosphatase (HAD superfamily)